MLIEIQAWSLLRNTAGTHFEPQHHNGCQIFTCISIMLLIKLFRIGPVTGPRLAVLDRGRRPRSNTADRGPVTGPIRNNLINEIFIN